MKSAPKGNFNCLTRPDFLRGGSTGWGGRGRQRREATGGKRRQRKGTKAARSQPSHRGASAERTPGLPQPFPGRRLQIIYAAKMALRIKI